MPATSPSPSLRRPPREPKYPPAIRTASARVQELGTALADAAPAEHAALIDAFWIEVAAAGTPLVERAPAGAAADSVTMTFVRRAPAATWAGDAYVLANKLSPVSDLDGARMERLEGTDVLHASFVVARTWRGSFRIAVVDTESSANVREHSAPDELCLDRLESTKGAWSVASMPDAPVRPWRAQSRTAIPTCTIAEAATDTARTCHVHVTGERPTALLVVLDGEAWGELEPVAPLLDHLTSTGAIEPVALVAPRAGDTDQRWREMGDVDPALTAFLAHDLLAWFRTEHGAAPGRAVVIGQSLGALAAARGLAADGSAFDAAYLQSPSLWLDDDAAIDELVTLLTRARAARPTVEVHLGIGSDEWVLAPRTTTLLERLDASGIDDVHTDTWAGGHDVACWLDGMARTLPALLGARE